MGAPDLGKEEKKHHRPRPAHEVPHPSLPKGGGALKSIGEKFSVNAVNGTSSLSVPLPFSHTRASGPALALTYNSGTGNGPFGLGWSLDLHSIARRTDRELPRYRDAGESDVFLLSGAEDLVPAHRKNTLGQWEPDADTVAGITIVRYRPRTEGLFARIEKISVPAQPGCYWKITTRDNVVTFYGASSASRIADPADPSRIFRWLPQLTYDDKGNCFEFIYQEEDLAHVPDSVEEQNRRNGVAPFTNRYLKRVLYGNKMPYFPNPATPWQALVPAAPNYFFEAVLDYGEHDVAAPTPATVRDWACRTDPFSDYRAGFEIRTYRLCRRVLFFHRFAELGAGATLVRSIDLDYLHLPFSGAPYQRHEAELVTAIRQVFYEGSGAGISSKNYPPMAFDYHPLAWDKTVHAVAPDAIVNAPAGASAGYQFVDLYGEGVQGILTEQANAWYYKSNLGGGRFSRVASVTPKPSFTGIASGALRLQDLNADGSKQVVVNGAGMAGYFALADDGQWQPFRSFQRMPNVAPDDKNARFIDLNGDGRADLLITEDVVLRWYPSAGTDGYDAPLECARALDEERGPALVFADGTQSIFLADMKGDGLTDIVRIRNADVCYWPNLGYGRFGAKVTMRAAPLFDQPDLFDPTRLRLFDVSGTGAADIIYLGHGGFTAYINLAGNAWSEPKPIDPFPGTEQPNQLSVVDLLGNGTGCLVWSSELPANASAPLRYVDLMGGRKPYILSGYRNNLGAQTLIEYKSSSFYYLRDKNEGRPWVTRLPFPTMCVSRHEQLDTVSGVRRVHAYSYRHGYYDHAEREFRGFAMVEQLDTESVERFAAGGAGQAVPATVHQAPVRTRSWYHTGALIDGAALLHQFGADYYRNAATAEAALPEPLIEEQPAAGLTALERRQAARACKGMLLRQEIYADDGSPLQALPFSTAQHNCRIRMLQPHFDQRYAVFLTHESESLTYHYERNPADPRIAHSLNIVIDDLGQVRETASVSYGRAMPDPSLPPAVQDEQARITILYGNHDYTNDVRTDASYRLRAACETRSYELSGIVAADTVFTLGEMQAAYNSAASLGFEEAPHAGLVEKRLLEQQRTLFASNADPDQPLPFKLLESLGLPFENLALAFTPSALGALFGSRVSPAMLAEGHYLRSADYKASGRFPASDPDGHYWAGSGSVQYPANPDQHFYLPERYLDATAAPTTVRYFSDYHLLVDGTEDPLGNRMTVEAFDWRFLQPLRSRDLNDNLSEVVFDMFGLVAGSAVRGKGAQADDLGGFVANLSDAQIQAFLADPEASGAALLQNASARFVYDMQALPAVAASITRETHHQQELADAVPTRLQYAFEYADGGGHVVMKKLQAEPGLASNCVVHPDGSYTIATVDTTPKRRWVGNGRTVRNNKGNAILQYEPYFAATPAFDTARELVESGVTPLLFYDATGRLVRTGYPDGSVSHLVFDNWKKSTYDQNDNVLASDWYAARIGGALGPAEQSAAQKTALHDDTPSVAHFDTHGRTHYAVAHNCFVDRVTSALVDEFYGTRSGTDIQGRTVSIDDPRGLRVMRYAYDLLGQEACSDSMDGGERRTLYDALGKALYGWDAKGNRFHTLYDTLHRPTRHEVLAPGGALRVSERTEYGTDKLLNQNGQMLVRHDPSGIVTNGAYDVDGNLLQTSRQFTALPSDETDWTTPAAIGLDPRVFVTSSHYDAVKRIIESVTPDNSRTLNHYNESNLLSGIEAGLRGAAPQGFITSIEHDAKGQRQRIVYGNGVSTEYTYDRFTFRVRSIVTTRAADGRKLQDLRYAYDPVGNITAVDDAAQQTTWFNNAVVSPSASLTYDAAYRLVAATGREQIGMNSAPDALDALRSHLPHMADGAALQNYLQQYQYDAASNMTAMAHAAGAGIFSNRWTRTFSVASDSNRLASSQVGAPLESFSYDNHGNLLAMPHLAAMDWNADNQLRHVDLGGGGDAWYNYDSDGHRLRKVVRRLGGLLEERLYIGALEIFRRSVNGVLVLERESLHVLDRDRRLALVDTRTAGADTSPAQLIRYQFCNHLGSAALELDALGAIISYEEYYPFGSTSFQSVDASREVPAKRYRYTGKERDEESGLYYHGSRYYLPWLARWSAPDPLGIKDGNNRYLYAGNRPVGSSDPTGMWEMPSWRTVAIVAAVVVVGVVVTVATAGVGTAVLGAAIGAAGLTGGAATAATVVGTVVVGAAAGAAGSWSATATGQVATGTYNAPGAAAERGAALRSGAVAGALTAGVGAALGAVARGGVAGVRAAQTATTASRAVALGTRTARGVALGTTAGATYEASRQQFTGEREARGGLDWHRIGTSAAVGAAFGGVTEAVAGPAMSRAGSRLFDSGYRAGLGVGSPGGRAAFFGPISRATGMNFVISAPGSSAGRPVISLATPRGPEAWYVRTGGGGITPGGAQPGDWAPFQGFAEQPGYYAGPGGSLSRAGPGWFVKTDSTSGIAGDAATFRLGGEAQLGTSGALGSWRLPVSTAETPYPELNGALRAGGVRVRPVPDIPFPQ